MSTYAKSFSLRVSRTGRSNWVGRVEQGTQIVQTWRRRRRPDDGRLSVDLRNNRCVQNSIGMTRLPRNMRVASGEEVVNMAAEVRSGCGLSCARRVGGVVGSRTQLMGWSLPKSVRLSLLSQIDHDINVILYEHHILQIRVSISSTQSLVYTDPYKTSSARW